MSKYNNVLIVRNDVERQAFVWADLIFRGLFSLAGEGIKHWEQAEVEEHHVTTHYNPMFGAWNAAGLPVDDSSFDYDAYEREQRKKWWDSLDLRVVYPGTKTITT